MTARRAQRDQSYSSLSVVGGESHTPRIKKRRIVSMPSFENTFQRSVMPPAMREMSRAMRQDANTIKRLLQILERIGRIQRHAWNRGRGITLSPSGAQPPAVALGFEGESAAQGSRRLLCRVRRRSATTATILRLRVRLVRAASAPSERRLESQSPEKVRPEKAKIDPSV